MGNLENGQGLESVIGRDLVKAIRRNLSMVKDLSQEIVTNLKPQCNTARDPRMQTDLDQDPENPNLNTGQIPDPKEVAAIRNFSMKVLLKNPSLPPVIK